MLKPLRGDVWSLDLKPTRGHEQAGKRPGLVLSENTFNIGPAGLVVVLPITTKHKGIPLHVGIDPQESGLKVKSFIKCEDIRSVSKLRFFSRLGAVDDGVMRKVEANVKILLGIF